jgi:hypothetical protein
MPWHHVPCMPGILIEKEEGKKKDGTKPLTHTCMHAGRERVEKIINGKKNHYSSRICIIHKVI